MGRNVGTCVCWRDNTLESFIWEGNLVAFQMLQRNYISKMISCDTFLEVDLLGHI